MWTLPDPALALHRPQPLLQQRDLALQPWPLYDSVGATALETWAATQLPQHRLMQVAGLGVARLAWALAPQAQGLWIVCGPGNNGGDGFEAALHWQQAGRRVHLSWAGDAQHLPPDAARSLARAQAAGVAITASFAPPGWLGPQDITLDALLGRGLSRPAEGPLAAAIHAANTGAAPILAIDLPSGLPGNTGALAPGAPCIRARWTLALLSLPPGLFTADGRDVAGDIWWDDLGVPPSPAAICAPTAWLGGGTGLLHTRPARQHAQHKGSFGDVWVVGGSAHMGGAALLAARAALRAGAGRVYVSPLSEPTGLADPAQPELMLGALAKLSPAQLQAATVVAGCGGGQAIAARLPQLIEHAGRLLLDADALNAVATDARLLNALRQRKATVITPHPLEAARLLNCSAAQVQADRLHAARELAAHCAATVVLKGSGSIVAHPGETPWILPVGNAALSTPGSGDVLAGWLGGLWSQWPRDLSRDHAAQAARLAVWQHGRTAERLSPCALALPASQLAAGLG
jgi:ADP-dependent NAD(P)H-hydrate dehydratase / NAD(P)H-hydrate epimerase